MTETDTSMASKVVLIKTLKEIIELQTVQWPSQPHWKMVRTAQLARAATKLVEEG